MTKTADTRERLLQTAADLIWTSSYHATGVDRICETAGVHKGSFYHHFESKEELAIAALDDQWTRMKPRVDAIFSPANRPLERLSGHGHEVLTAVALKHDEWIETALSRSEVRFKALSAQEIAQYTASGECDDKAGAYAIQGRAGRFVAELRGSYSGVMGLPLYDTGELLDKLQAARR